MCPKIIKEQIKYSKLEDNFTNPTIKKAFELLETAGLFTTSADSIAETDYLIEKESEIIPVEVKSGKSGRLRSLHLLLNSFPNVKSAGVLKEDKTGELPEKRIKFMPLLKAGAL